MAELRVLVPYIDHHNGPRDQTLTTPREFFDKLHARFRFTLDGAASDENALLPRYSTIANPMPWNNERVFCNPPWKDIRTFVELAPLARFACLLVPSRTNSKWFHRALELGATPEFFLGRLTFGGLKHCSPADCNLLIFTKG